MNFMIGFIWGFILGGGLLILTADSWIRKHKGDK
jgi:hypothetical protein